jgi:hypothetical protein
MPAFKAGGPCRYLCWKSLCIDGRGEQTSPSWPSLLVCTACTPCSTVTVHLLRGRQWEQVGQAIQKAESRELDRALAVMGCICKEGPVTQ